MVGLTELNLPINQHKKLIMKMRYKLLLLAAFVPMMLGAQTKKWDAYRAENGISLPTWNIKTNLLADLTTSMNLGFEFRTGNHTSLEIVGQWNPFSYRGGLTEWRHIGAQPEFRYWLKETFRGHFFGLQGTYTFYNVGGLPNGPFTDYMHNNRFEGDLYGAGVSWGHRWNFSRRWGLEVTAAVGYLFKDYEMFECVSCGKSLGKNTKSYFGPTEIGVNLIFGGGSKAVAVVAPPVAPAPTPAPIVKQRYEPVFTPSFVEPAVEEVKVRAESGSAYLEFPVGSSVIQNNFRNNAAELAKIDQMVTNVKNTPDATITGITLVGYASPEGSFQSNVSLSQRRAEALRAYLNRTYGFSGGLVTANGAGEDWSGLSALVAESNIVGRGALLDVINGSAGYDSRDKLMAAANGDGYRAMIAEIYPKLRRTDYKLDFQVAPISVERGKSIMRTNPRMLSLNELFLISNTYRAGSEEFREVMDIAARAFPDSDIANNNAAAAAIQRNDLSAAASFLGKVRNHDADWNNNMGILSYLQGNANAAAGYFRAAGAKATNNAAELAKHLESIR
jgi:outer membrane protein OmpA-like peptidoglycan-associated protein